MKDPHPNSQSSQESSSPSDSPSKAAKAFPPDPIDLAERSALISFVQKEAKRIPDIRQDRVEQIRAALQSRNYHISSDLLADKIIQDILLDEPSAQD